jgi:hypothetical protein
MSWALVAGRIVSVGQDIRLRIGAPLQRLETLDNPAAAWLCLYDGRSSGGVGEWR